MSELYAKFDLSLTDQFLYGGYSVSDYSIDHAYSYANIGGQGYYVKSYTTNPLYADAGSYSGSVTGSNSVPAAFGNPATVYPVNTSFSGGVTNVVYYSGYDYNPDFLPHDTESPSNIAASVGSSNNISAAVGVQATYSGQYTIVSDGSNPSESISDFTSSNQNIPVSLDAGYGKLTGNVTIPNYVWVDMGTAPDLSNPPTKSPAVLFTSGSEIVNFNNLTPDQTKAISNEAPYHDGKGGGDTVVLPDHNYLITDLNQGVPFYTGSISGQVTNIGIGVGPYAGDGSYYVALGAGSDTVTMAGSGHLTVDGGNGAGTLTLSGTGSTTLNVGSGTDSLSVKGLLASGSATIHFTGDNQTVVITDGNGSLGNITVTGFNFTDKIVFTNSSNVTTSAEYNTGAIRSPGELDIYSAKTQIATLIFDSKTDSHQLEPISDALGGTAIKLDGSNIQIANYQTKNSNVDWDFVRKGEGSELEPYVLLSGNSGVTIGTGVDLANGTISQNSVKSIFPDYSYNKNLQIVFDATHDVPGNADTLDYAVDYLNSVGVTRQVISKNGLVTYQLVSSSLTQSQANALSNRAEQDQLDKTVKSWGKASPSVLFSSLPSQAQTVVLDLVYNTGGISGSADVNNALVFASNTISNTNEYGDAAAWAQVATALRNYGGSSQSRRTYEATKIDELVQFIKTKQSAPIGPNNPINPDQSSNPDPVNHDGGIGDGGVKVASVGLVVHDVGSAGGMVFALYEGLLGRMPDSAGLQSWLAALNNGTSQHDVTTAMLASTEVQAHLNATDNAGFVAQVYETVLHREADAAGLQSWTAALDSGTLSRADFVDAAVFSPEHVASIQPALDAGVFVPDLNAVAIAQLYYATLGRGPDAGGLQAYTAALESGATSLHDIAQAALGSDEYAAKTGAISDSAYVESVYEQVLGRHSDAAGLQAWTDALSHGSARVSVAIAAVDSSEFQGQYASHSNAAYVEGLYEHLFGRQGDASGLQSWTNALDSHATTRVDLANAFVNSAEFQAHLGLQNGGVSDAAFVESLYENALGRHAEASGLQGWTDALAHGTSRADVAVAIAEGTEAQQHLAAQIQQSYHVA